jgi:FdhD protein
VRFPNAVARAGEVTVQVRRLSAGVLAVAPDRVVREDPLQVLVDSRPLGILMRTPGSDLELALGLLHSEQIVHSPADVAAVRLAPSGQGMLGAMGVQVELDPEAENLVDVRLARPWAPGSSGWQRALLSSSACGICGAATMDAIRRTHPRVGGGGTFALERLLQLPDQLRASQRLFHTTGGLHAAGLLLPGADELEVAEDVGRHNAVDKLVGRMFLADGLPLTDSCLVVSGRAGFEIVQKAAAAGIALVASISAPSSLAVEVAELTGITLVGFLRPGGANVYTHSERLAALPGILV